MENEPGGKHWGWRRAVLAIVGLLVLYPLSVGPMNWVMIVTGLDRMAVIYAPLNWAANTWRPIEHLLTWYLRLWGLPGA